MSKRASQSYADTRQQLTVNVGQGNIFSLKQHRGAFAAVLTTPSLGHDGPYSCIPCSDTHLCVYGPEYPLTGAEYKNSGLAWSCPSQGYYSRAD